MGGNEPRLEQEKKKAPSHPQWPKGAPSHSIFFWFGGGGVEAKLRWDNGAEGCGASWPRWNES